MTKRENAPGYVSNPRYTQDDWNEVSDNPPLTDAELSQARPNGEGLPHAMAGAFRRLGGRPKSEAKAVPVSLRVPPAILDAYKAGGPGWQTRMIAALTEGLEPRTAAEEIEDIDRAARRRTKPKKVASAAANDGIAASERSPAVEAAVAPAIERPQPHLPGSRRLYPRKRAPKSA